MMDGFTAGLTVFVLWSGLMFTVGHYFPQADLARDCTKTGQMTVSRVVFECKPVGMIVDGRRMEINQ
jgi:hypothetical protein